jgi:hypothetical protein
MPTLTLSIASPCHEDWNNMSPTQRGAHCLACNKEVIDFTTWTNRDVINYLSKSSSVCGRLRPDQLQPHIPIERKDKRRWWLALTVVMSLVLSNSVVAQSGRKAQTEQVDGNTSETRRVKLKEWSARISTINKSTREIRPKHDHDVLTMLLGKVGEVSMVITPVEEEARTWYSTIFDMLRK